MEWFDCNAYFGLPTKRPLRPVETAEALLAEMDRAGIDRALVWHVAQHDYSPTVGNEMLVRAIAAHDRLVGCCVVLPPQTHEMPRAPHLFDWMASARLRAVRVFPLANRYEFHAATLGGVLEAMDRRQVPLLVSMARGVAWGDLYRLLEAIPSLVCVVCDHGCWGQDRLFRPLLDTFPNVYVDTAGYLLDGGIEALVADYGAGRLVFGTGFPDHYHGGMMLTLRHARISDEDRQAIAGGNLVRLLGEAEL